MLWGIKDLQWNFGDHKRAPQSKKQAYLEPNSQSMQKPVEGAYPAAENVEDRVAIGGFRNQKHVGSYLKRGYKSEIAQRVQLYSLNV